MNFDKIYEKYQNGTATEEERAYIESEIAKARKLTSIIDELDAKRVIEPAQPAEVLKVQKTMKKRLNIRVLVITLLVIATLVLATAASVFAYVNVKASGRAEYNREECIELAKKSVNDHSENASTHLVVLEVDRDVRFYNGKLSRATYVYEIEVVKGILQYEVEVDSATGKAVIVDVDD